MSPGQTVIVSSVVYIIQARLSVARRSFQQLTLPCVNEQANAERPMIRKFDFSGLTKSGEATFEALGGRRFTIASERIVFAYFIVSWLIERFLAV